MQSHPPPPRSVVASLFLFLVIGCLPCAVVDAKDVSWHVDGATLVDWGTGSLVVSNATDFQLVNADISATKLELQLTSMATLALLPPMTQSQPVVSATIRNTRFSAESQLWVVGGNSDHGVRFDVLVEGCTFSESLFALMDVLMADGSRFRFINNTMTRTKAMGGATHNLFKTGAALLSSPAPVLVAAA